MKKDQEQKREREDEVKQKKIHINGDEEKS